MKSSKEYYSEIYYSGVDRYFECKMRAQEYYIKKNKIMFASLLFNCMIRKA